MAERKFDYENISTIYNEMKKITGSAGDTDSIAGILDKIDKDVHESVGVEDEAIFGDLGSQLLLNWDNTSAPFGEFVNSFQNWSALVSQSADKYKEFEEKVNGIKTSNPLGYASNGIKDAYTNTGFYSQYAQDNKTDYEARLASQRSLNTITGANYVFTDTASLLKWHKVAGYTMFGGDLLAAGTIFAYTHITTLSTALVPVEGGAGTAGTGTGMVPSGGATGAGGAGATGTGATGATTSGGAAVGSETISTAATGGTTGATFSANGATYTNFEQIKIAVEGGALDKRTALNAIKSLYGMGDGTIGHTYMSNVINYFKFGKWM